MTLVSFSSAEDALFNHVKHMTLLDRRVLKIRCSTFWGTPGIVTTQGKQEEKKWSIWAGGCYRQVAAIVDLDTQNTGVVTMTDFTAYILLASKEFIL